MPRLSCRTEYMILADDHECALMPWIEAAACWAVCVLFSTASCSVLCGVLDSTHLDRRTCCNAHAVSLGLFVALFVALYVAVFVALFVALFVVLFVVLFVALFRAMLTLGLWAPFLPNQGETARQLNSPITARHISARRASPGRPVMHAQPTGPFHRSIAVPWLPMCTQRQIQSVKCRVHAMAAKAHAVVAPRHVVRYLSSMLGIWWSTAWYAANC